MKRLLHRILGGDTIAPTPAAKKCLNASFKNAKSIEWSEFENGYEAIFYIQEQEYISHITKDGVLTEYKINLSPSNLPDVIKNAAALHGEIMNAISIHQTDSETTYELITRNHELNRYTVLLHSDGSLVKKNKL